VGGKSQKNTEVLKRGVAEKKQVRGFPWRGLDGKKESGAKRHLRGGGEPNLGVIGFSKVNTNAIKLERVRALFRKHIRDKSRLIYYQTRSARRGEYLRGKDGCTGGQKPVKKPKTKKPKGSCTATCIKQNENAIGTKNRKGKATSRKGARAETHNQRAKCSALGKTVGKGKA